MKCPNKSSKEWRELVAKVGETKAYMLWDSPPVPNVEPGLISWREYEGVYDHYKLFNKSGNLKQMPRTDAVKWVQFLNKNANPKFSFSMGKAPTGLNTILINKSPLYSTSDRKDSDAIEEAKRFMDVTPNVPLKVQTGVIVSGEVLADGMFHNNMVTIADIGSKGRAYHEAFHAVTQMFMTDAERNSLYDSAYPDAETALIAEESLAEDFRAYMLGHETKSTLRKLFDGIKELVNYILGDKKSKLFRDIRKKRYADKQLTTTNSKLFNRIDLAPEVRRDMVEAFAFMAIKSSDLSKGSDGAIANWDQMSPALRERAGQFRDAFDAHNDPIKAENYSKVYDQWDIFEHGIRDYLKGMNLVPNTKDEISEDNAKESLNITDALNIDSKLNAAGFTKLLLSTLVDTGKVSQHTGAPKLVAFKDAWKELINELPGTLADLPGKGVQEFALDKMIGKLETLAAKNPSLHALVTTLKDPATSDQIKRQFVTTFSKQNIAYSSSVYNHETGEYRIFNSDSNNQSVIVHNDWENSVSDVMKEKGFKAVKSTVRSKVAAIRKAATDDAAIKHTIELYKEVGIPISESAVRSYLNDMRATLGPKTKAKKGKPAVPYSDKDLIIMVNNKTMLAPFDNKYQDTSMVNSERWDRESNFFSDNSVFSTLAVHEANTKNLPGEGVVLGKEGNQYYTKSANHFMSKTMNYLVANDTLVNNMLTKDWHYASKFLKQISDAHKKGNASKFGLDVFLSNRYDGLDDAGEDFSGMIEKDEIVERINRMLSSNPAYSPLTFGDKSTWINIRGFKIDDFKGDIADAATEMYDYVKAEADRMDTLDPDIRVYKKSKKQFYLFPQLNNDPMVFNEDGDLNEQYVLDHLEKVIQDRMEEVRNYLEEHSLIKDGSMLGLDKDVSTKKYAAYNNIDVLLLDIAAKSMIANIEHTMLFSGDPAFYKDLSKRTQSGSGTGEDLAIMNKDENYFNMAVVNEYEIKSDFYDGYVDLIEKKFKGHKDARAKAVAAAEAYMKLEEADAAGYITGERWKFLKTGLGEWSEAHEESYERLMDPEATLHHSDILRMQPEKGMHYELVEQGGRLTPVYIKYSQATLWPALVKGTKMENLLTEMGNKEVDEVVFASGVKVGAQGEADSTSLIKDESISLSPIRLSNHYWKRQNDLQAKYMKKRKALEGSQFKVNIFGNLNMQSTEYNGQSGRELYDESVALDKELSTRGRTSLEKKWGVVNHRITDVKPLYDDMIKSFREDGMPSNVIEALEGHAPLDAVFQIGEKPEQSLLGSINNNVVKLKMPGGAFIQIPSYGFQKVDAMTDTEISEAGGIKYLVDTEYLKGPRMEEDGFKRAQVFLPHYIIKKMRDDHNDEIIAKYGKGIDELSKEQLNKVFGDTLTGVIGYRIPNQGMSSIDTMEIVGILPEHMGDSIVTYREVTAKTGSDFDIDKMYMMHHNLEFVDGKLRKVPYIKGNDRNSALERYRAMYDGKDNKPTFEEFNTQGENESLHEMEARQNTSDAVQNRKLQLYDDVLMSPEAQGHLVTPIDSGWLSDDAYYLAVLSEKGSKAAKEFKEASNKKAWLNENFNANEDLQFFSMVEQVKIKMRNMAGKTGTAQTANHLTHHVLSQIADLNISGKFNIPGYEDGRHSLARDVNDEGDYITDVVSAWLNAYVDNAKDPYISLINNNNKTADTVFMLLRMGVSPFYVNRIMSQPIVKDYVKFMYSEESKATKTFDEAPKLKIKTVKLVDGEYEVSGVPKKQVKLFGINKFLIQQQVRPEDIASINSAALTEAQLEDQIAKPNKDIQLGVLKDFLRLMENGGKLRDAVLASKTATQGTTESALEANRILQTRDAIIQENVIGNFEELFRGTHLEHYTENSIGFMNASVSPLLLSATPKVNNTIGAIVDATGIPNTKDTRRKIFKDYKTYLYSATPVFNMTAERKALVIKSVPKIVKQLKKVMPEHPFVQAITVKHNKVKDDYSTSGYSYTPYVSTSFNRKDPVDVENIWLSLEGWLDSTETVKINNKNVSFNTIHTLLAQYAFLNSGFHKNKNSFAEYLSPVFLKKAGFYANMDMQLAANQDYAIDTNFIEQWARNNIDMLVNKDVPVNSGKLIELNENLPDIFRKGKRIFMKSNKDTYVSPSILGHAEEKIMYKEYNKNAPLTASYRSGRKASESLVIKPSKPVLPIKYTQTEDTLVMEGLEEHPVTLTEHQIEEDGAAITVYVATISNNNRTFTLSVDAYGTKEEALNDARASLNSVGLDAITAVLKKAC